MEKDAGIVIKDNGVNDFSVCKSYRGGTIKISKCGYDSDLTVKIS